MTGQFELSCGDHPFPSLPHEAVLDLVAALGFEGFRLVLWGEQSHVNPQAVRADIDRWAGRLEERIRSRGLELVDVVCTPYSDHRAAALNHPDGAQRAESDAFVRDMIEFVARLGAPGMTMAPGFDWDGETHEESLERAIQQLRSYVTAAHDRGVAFSIEPHRGSVCQTPEDAERLCRAVPGLELTLDYSQFAFSGIAQEDVDSLVPKARFVHARAAAPGYLQVPMRDNVIDYERVVDVLDANDYSGWIEVEYFVEPEMRFDVLWEIVALRDVLRTAMDRLRAPIQ